MKIRSMLSPKTGKPIPNQFTAEFESNGKRVEQFHSYDTLIAERVAGGGEIVTYLSDYWDYSKTTTKYLNEFLGLDNKTVKAKVKSGEFKLVPSSRDTERLS